VIVNQRNQSLSQLLVQIKHYSAASRKDALAGLRELFAEHPAVLLENIGFVHESIVECTCACGRRVWVCVSCQQC
jgi:pre-rRNA-processing protein IPI1